MRRLNQEELGELAEVLVGTKQSVSSGLRNIGLKAGLYDMDDVTVDLEEEGVHRCEECSDWTDEGSICGVCKEL